MVNRSTENNVRRVMGPREKARTITTRAALTGERPLTALARFIAKTMPEDAPGECVGEDAEKVAAYIYEAFYSKAGKRPATSFKLPDRAVSSDSAAVPQRRRRPGREFPRCAAAGTNSGA